MKYISKFFFIVLGLAFVFAGCDKVKDLPYYKNGNAPILSSTVAAVAAAPSDSSNNVISFLWTSPKYSTDANTVKFIVQIDSAGRNFSNAASRTLIADLGTSFTGKQINDILLGFGFSFAVAYDVDIRVLSSYGNNNEQLASNTITLKMTPYKIPPKIALPVSGKLFIVGSATTGGWNNPVPTPSQELTQIDETTYGGVFNLSGGNEYLILPVNGSWDTKYSVADKYAEGLSNGGDFGFGLNDNFPAPATSGQYKIILDFQKGKFTVTPYTGSLPTDLFMVGDATPGGWNNPVPGDQQFTRINSSVFQITLPLNGGAQYLMLPVNGSWDHKFSVSDNSIPGLSDGGDFGYDLSSNFPAPATSGTYKVEANFVTNKFKVTPQ